MKLALDLSLITKLREKIGEYPVLMDTLQFEFKIPSTEKKHYSKEHSAYNCLCAALDRICETAKHCNLLDTSKNNSNRLFAFYDLLNYSQTLIECITILGRIFGVKYAPCNEKPCFSYVSRSGKGNDEKYFKYLRSLCAVHPVNTNAHPEYQGEEPEWCPYVAVGKSFTDSMRHPDWGKVDFVAVMYRNDMQFSKTLPIYLSEMFAYIRKRYRFLEKIIDAVTAWQQKCINALKNKHIPTLDECPDYATYLKELETAIQERCGSFGYTCEWLTILQTSYKDVYMQNLLVQYQSKLKEVIQNIHNQLQKMDCNELDLHVFDVCLGNVLPEYEYELEKINYLDTNRYIESPDCNISLALINAPLNFDKERMIWMLSVMDNAIQQKATHADLSSLASVINDKCHLNNSEWARIQLKIIEFALNKYVKFDYVQNDWHLYLQFQIAKWCLGKEGESDAKIQ